MNREILFRGKCFNTDEWVEGYLGIEVPDELVIQQFSFDEYFKSNCIDQYSLKPETIGQYTGLTDKNNVRVFEGDIVRVFDGEYINYAVSFDGKHGAFVIGNASFWYYVPDIEVIGNIYDSPELMEATK